MNQDGKSSSKNAEEMTSAERAVRHGELKQLRRLKRARENENSAHKPKMLKAMNRMELELQEDENEDDTANDDNAGEATDLRDIEFRMKNDPMQVRVST